MLSLYFEADLPPLREGLACETTNQFEVTLLSIVSNRLSLYTYIAGTAHLYQRDRQPYIMQTKTDTHQQALGWSQCLHSTTAGEPTPPPPPSSQEDQRGD